MQTEHEQQERRVITVIYKSDKHQIQVSLAKYRGRRFGDLRLYVTNSQGELVPTRKGITLDVSRLDELEGAVAKLRDAAVHSTHPF